ncbi:MAG: helix-turn-helix transcriptional regulator [Eubacteriales bacterium]|jgi:transcriptional regulator with XRE-family HTH domain|nr:helix-turn-helix transcriptional regulator [Eubacteriales bacterium]
MRAQVNEQKPHKTKNAQNDYAKSQGSFPLVTYGRMIKRIRERRRISQMELARRSNLSVSFISSVENGKTATSISNAAEISNALGVPLSIMCDAVYQIASLSGSQRENNRKDTDIS